MALFGLLWLLRLRAQVNPAAASAASAGPRCTCVSSCGESCDNCAISCSDGSPTDLIAHEPPLHQRHDAPLFSPLLPPPVPFADIDAGIPPPPPPPSSASAARHRRSLQNINSATLPAHPKSYFSSLATVHAVQSQLSHSVHNISTDVQCTCPVPASVGVASRRLNSVRFLDDPLGYYSAANKERAESWNYPSVLTTLSRNRSRISKQNRGIFLFYFFTVPPPLPLLPEFAYILAYFFFSHFSIFKSIFKCFKSIFKCFKSIFNCLKSIFSDLRSIFKCFKSISKCFKSISNDFNHISLN